ncbi:MAG: acyl-CoA dehydrogenase family protein [Xanthomonadales bacterium]|nr:acyl-CoA dehydrogenase family protein [Xanthomonadales bacterium]
MDFSLSAKARDYRDRVHRFVQQRAIPYETQYRDEIKDLCPREQWQQWQMPKGINTLKAAAREQGLWNLFLPDAELGAGLSHVEYASVAEAMGQSLIAAELFNCNAPDTGNMEVLWKYGSDEQKSRWLQPLLKGEIRSAFCMTEPDVASSDATNMQAQARIEGEQVILNGSKWWSTGIGHPDCRVLIFMGLSFPDQPRHQQHSMVLVPLDTPGVNIERMLSIHGDEDAPYGHGQVRFDKVSLPADHVILGPGRGFEIAQGRLGPGRIHHCMRCIGAAERVLKMAIERGMQRQAFGKPLMLLEGNRRTLAELRLAIDQARLLTLSTAWKLDQLGVHKALVDVSAIKVIAPRVLQQVVDFAIQIHGAAGLSDELPLTGFHLMARSLRLADGPDEVHQAMISRLELKAYR